MELYIVEAGVGHGWPFKANPYCPLPPRPCFAICIIVHHPSPSFTIILHQHYRAIYTININISIDINYIVICDLDLFDIFYISFLKKKLTYDIYILLSIDIIGGPIGMFKII